MTEDWDEATFLLLQEADGPLEDGGLVHLPRETLALQHGPQLLDEHIELVAALLLRLVAGRSVPRGPQQTQGQADTRQGEGDKR